MWIQQSWYADDAAAGGKLVHIQRWWDDLVNCGPSYGYFPNASKTWLVVKKSIEEEAKWIFQNSGIKITSHGQPYLGSPLGCPAFVKEFVGLSLDVSYQYSNRGGHVSTACGICCLFPWLVRCLVLCRTTPNISDLLHPLDDAILRLYNPHLNRSSDTQ